MSMQELIDSPMPKYSNNEETFNSVSHFIGVLLGFAVLVAGIVLSINHKLGALTIISLIVYGICIILLYSMSSIYHGLHKDKVSKKVMRVIDHCTIYLLIAGTYTPICIHMLPMWEGYVMLISQWVFAIVGIVINAYALNNKSVTIISMILYILMGWMIIFFPSVVKALPTASFALILTGGIIYTIGSILYGIGSKKPWFHSIFHICCLLGTLTQAIGILLIL